VYSLCSPSILDQSFHFLQFQGTCVSLFKLFALLSLMMSGVTELRERTDFPFFSTIFARLSSLNSIWMPSLKVLTVRSCL
jgi:hypothetical protein